MTGVLLEEGDIFPCSVQVENELGNSTQINSSLAVISEFPTWGLTYIMYICITFAYLVFTPHVYGMYIIIIIFFILIFIYTYISCESINI